MSTTPSRPALHPMLWVAAASVTALSLAGVAKLTGLLPESGTAAPQTSAVTGAVAPEPVAPTRLATAEPAEPASAVSCGTVIGPSTGCPPVIATASLYSSL